MRPLSRLLVVVGFLAFICVPLVLTLAGQRPGATDNRAAGDLPALSARRLVDEQTYQELDRYLSDQFALRALAIRADAKLDDVLWKGDRGDVRRGEDGWLYYAPSLTQLCTEPLAPVDAVRVLDRFAAGLESQGTTFRYLLVPEKSTLYPEHLTDRLRDDAACGREAVDVLRGELGQPTRPWYVDLYEPLAELKARHVEPVYHQRDTHWNAVGASRFVAEVVRSLDPDLEPDDELRQVGTVPFELDLTRLLGLPQTVQIPQFQAVRPGVTTTAGEERTVQGAVPLLRYTSSSTGAGVVDGRSVVIYDSFGLAALDLLAPFFADVTFVHWNALGDPQVEALLDGADTVVAEGAEREFTWRMADKLQATGLADRWQGG
ncbi:MAG: hypothetical protein GEV08_19875 [Acidimicrobiia bacterium]|nr:hypothetical protein [Acidimicrobiia bacterium]